MHKIPALGILSCLLLAIAGCGGDSDTPDADAAVGYIPDKAFAAIVIYPQRALKSSVAKRLGIDKLLGSLSEGDLPFDVAKVEQITVVFASAEEEPLVIFQFSEAQDKGKMLAFRLFKELEKLTHNGKEYYGRNEFSSSEAVTFPDDRTMIVAVSSDQMKEVLSASGSSGLGKALGEVDGDYDLIAVVQLALVRADLQSLLSEKDDDLANLPNQVETIIATGKLDPTLRVDIVVKTISDDAAKEVESTIRMGVGMAVGAMGVLGQAAGDTMGPDAAGKLTSVLGQLLTSIQPQVDGDEIRISIIAPDGTNALLDEIAKFIKQELTPTDGFKDETEKDAVFSDEVAKDGDITDEAKKDGFRSDEKR